MPDRRSRPVTPEFARPADVSRLEDGEEMHESIAANAEEMMRLADRFDLQEISRLEAEIDLARSGRQVEVEASFRAAVVQTCVVTLDPVPATLEERFVQVYDPDVRPTGEFDEPLSVDDDPPEPLIDETIDLGEMVAERLGLALDPYPRKEDATVDPRYLARDEGEAERTGPFAALEALKRR